MSEKIYTISAYTENCPGVLHRLTTAFTKRKINIESLTVSETETKGISIFTIVVKCEEKIISTIIKQLKRIIEVRQVFAFEDHQVIAGEIAFIKVSTPDAEQRSVLEQIALRYQAQIVHIDQQSVIIQITGSADHIESLYRLLEPRGIEEFVRSGRIAVKKQAGVGLEA